MKKISEMTLEELQDYALSQDSKIKQLEEDNTKATKENAELTELNKSLQKRNNDLFMKVEQQETGGSNDPEEKEKADEIQSCEDFARNLLEGDK